mmetsp:Transcript_57789/g.118273  ORF Transcript_57789/g.118273 Transcript_57789/m.118273 type:complete len:322 (+) Transcript_57789:1178-2143(+)
MLDGHFDHPLLDDDSLNLNRDLLDDDLLHSHGNLLHNDPFDRDLNVLLHDPLHRHLNILLHNLLDFHSNFPVHHTLHRNLLDNLLLHDAVHRDLNLLHDDLVHRHGYLVVHDLLGWDLIPAFDDPLCLDRNNFFNRNFPVLIDHLYLLHWNLPVLVNHLQLLHWNLSFHRHKLFHWHLPVHLDDLFHWDLHRRGRRGRSGGGGTLNWRLLLRRFLHHRFLLWGGGRRPYRGGRGRAGPYRGRNLGRRWRGWRRVDDGLRLCVDHLNGALFVDSHRHLLHHWRVGHNLLRCHADWDLDRRCHGLVDRSRSRDRRVGRVGSGL